MDFIVAKDDVGVGGGDSWRYETCIWSNHHPPTYQHPVFLQASGQMHFLLPNQECQSNNGKQN